MKDELSQPLVSGDVSEDTEERMQTLRNQLHAAVADNNVREVRKLLHLRDRGGAALVFADSDQCSITPLHRACQLGHPRVVQLLIAEGANVDYRDATGRTPLHYACTEYSALSPDALHVMLVCRRVCVKLLMKAGADPRAVDQNNETPIDLALKPSQFVFLIPLLFLIFALLLMFFLMLSAVVQDIHIGEMHGHQDTGAVHARGRTRERRPAEDRPGGAPDPARRERHGLLWLLHASLMRVHCSASVCLAVCLYVLVDERRKGWKGKKIEESICSVAVVFTCERPERAWTR